jgi:hypothetical protein
MNLRESNTTTQDYRRRRSTADAIRRTLFERRPLMPGSRFIAALLAASAASRGPGDTGQESGRV